MEDKWTLFWDMHSGGGCKEEPYEKIYIEAPIEEAKIIFYNRFGHNPERVSCTCCGQDYSIDEDNSIEQLSAYHRNCKYDTLSKKYIESPEYDSISLLTLEQYSNRDDVLIVYKSEIKDEERVGEMPQQGFIWH